MNALAVYSLNVVADKVCGYMFDDYENQDFFEDFLIPNFNGAPLSSDWELPHHELNLPRSPMQDFMFGYPKAPFVSERVSQCMREALESKVQFWPLGEIKGVPYYIFNVINLVDALDESRSRIVRGEGGRILNVTQAVFSNDLSEEVTIFKIPQDTRNIFVTSPFVEMVRQCRLTGVGFEMADNRTPWQPIDAFPDLPILNTKKNGTRRTEKE